MELSGAEIVVRCLQEEGVDEADLVKTNGRQVYTFAHDASERRIPRIRIARVEDEGGVILPAGSVALASGQRCATLTAQAARTSPADSLGKRARSGALSLPIPTPRPSSAGTVPAQNASISRAPPPTDPVPAASTTNA